MKIIFPGKTKLLKIIHFLDKVRNNKVFLASLGIFILLYIIPVPRFTSPTSTVIESAEGRLMGAKIAKDDQWHFPGLDSIPYKAAICSRLFEDEYFYYHPGINPVSLARALIQNIKAGKTVSGGSTITMQLIRIISGNKKRTYLQKIKEMMMTISCELKYSKNSILLNYLDNAPYGGNIVGLEAASWKYFGRSPHQLSWSESAVLAVLPNAPSLVYPGKRQEKLLRKRNLLLKKLYARNYIDSIEYVLAKMEKLPQRTIRIKQEAPHLLERLALDNEGKRIKTTLRFPVQENVNAIISRHHQSLIHNKIYNACALVIENQSKKVLAYVGNTRNNNPEHGSMVDIIHAPRSTGSILKPLLFTAMITDGILLPDMLVADIPTQFKGYSPKNYNFNYDGAVPAKKALSRSLNVPAVRMLHLYGTKKFMEYLHALNFKTINQPADYYGLSIILGGAEASLWDLGNTYSSLALVLNNYLENNGSYNKQDWRELTFIQNTTTDKQSLSQHPVESFHVFSASAIYSTFQSLLEVNRPASEHGWEMFSSSRNIAWKTGTSFGYRDAWAIGVTPEYTVCVWVGNADGEGRPLLTGVSAAAPIMFEIFDILPPTTWFMIPYDDMIKMPVCRESGYRPSQSCSNVDTILVPGQAKKIALCPFHIIIHLDSTGLYQVNSNCYPQKFMKHTSWFVLPPAWEWYFKKNNPFYKALPPFKPGCLNNNNVQEMEFLYPTRNANVYVPKDITGRYSEVVFKVIHRESNSTIFWHLDNEYIGKSFRFHEMGVRPTKGKHILTVVDEKGNTLSKGFNVMGKKNEP